MRLIADEIRQARSGTVRCQYAGLMTQHVGDRPTVTGEHDRDVSEDPATVMTRREVAMGQGFRNHSRGPTRSAMSRGYDAGSLGHHAETIGASTWIRS